MRRTVKEFEHVGGDLDAGPNFHELISLAGSFSSARKSYLGGGFEDNDMMSSLAERESCGHTPNAWCCQYRATWVLR